DLDRRDVRAAQRERAGQDAEARADLEHRVAGLDTRQGHEPLGAARIDEEVLPQAAPGREPVARQQRADLAGAHSATQGAPPSGTREKESTARPWSSPRASGRAPAAAIITALSVQSESGGSARWKPSRCAASASSARSRMFAATPPTTASC